MTLYIDNSKRGSYATCPRKYFYRYIKNLTSAKGSTALRFGSTWHAVLEGYYNSVKQNGWDADNISPAFALGQKVWDEETGEMEFYDDYRNLEECLNSFIEYLEEYQSDKHIKEIISSERIFNIEMKITKEEIKLYPYLGIIPLHFTGKLDLEIELSGQRWIEEFKSTGQPIQLQADRLQRSAQILGYTWASKYLGLDPIGVLISIHQILSRKKVNGTYGKFTRKFLRQPNIFSDRDLEFWKGSFLYTCNQIIESMEKDDFPCQYDSCYQFGKCGFARLCEQNRLFNDLNLDGFIVKEWDVLKSGSSKEMTNDILISK